MKKSIFIDKKKGKGRKRGISILIFDEVIIVETLKKVKMMNAKVKVPNGASSKQKIGNNLPITGQGLKIGG